MPQPVDVGSVLGGRYKVTAYVLASADRDLVLDGMDQVLNRPVSILVASASNADQIAATAREVATGERAGNIQVLDLGVTDESTYLVTNRASPADLLDLVVPQDAPFVEPFFTDTLGSEIFGGPRSTEPELYDDDDDYGPDEEDDRPARKSRLSKARLPKFGKAAPAAGAAGVAAGAAAPGAAPSSSPAPASQVPPPPASAPRVAEGGTSGQGQPKVSLWSDQDYDADSGNSRSHQTGRAASHFPAAAATGTPVGDDYDEYDESEEDDDRGNNPKYTRVLVGVVLTIILVTVVALAVNQLSGFFSPDPTAGPGTTTTQAAEPTEDGTATPSEDGTDSAEPTAEPVDPVPTGVTRLVPDNAELNAEGDGDLPLIIDGNPGSFWGSLVYANETFGGLAQNMALVVELEEESTISQIQIEQLNGSGGSFTVLLNDEPTLDGAEQIAQSSFTGPSINIPVPPTDDGEPATAQYIIVNLTQLPRLTNVQAVFPWGVRIAEISAS